MSIFRYRIHGLRATLTCFFRQSIERIWDIAKPVKTASKNFQSGLTHSPAHVWDSNKVFKRIGETYLFTKWNATIDRSTKKALNQEPWVAWFETVAFVSRRPLICEGCMWDCGTVVTTDAIMLLSSSVLNPRYFHIHFRNNGKYAWS